MHTNIFPRSVSVISKGTHSAGVINAEICMEELQQVSHFCSVFIHSLLYLFYQCSI